MTEGSHVKQSRFCWSQKRDLIKALSLGWCGYLSHGRDSFAQKYLYSPLVEVQGQTASSASAGNFHTERWCQFIVKFECTNQWSNQFKSDHCSQRREISVLKEDKYYKSKIIWSWKYFYNMPVRLLTRVIIFWWRMRQFPLSEVWILNRFLNLSNPATSFNSTLNFKSLFPVMYLTPILNSQLRTWNSQKFLPLELWNTTFIRMTY